MRPGHLADQGLVRADGPSGVVDEHLADANDRTTSSAASARRRSRPTSSPSRPHPSAGAPATR
ncbi:MAG: hypothetical protein R3A10_10925 [Caldilineaceae bacterium]